jgi:hypothetical protein
MFLWALSVTITEHGLKVLEKMLMRILGTKRQGITGEWRILYNEKLNNFCSPQIIINDIIFPFHSTLYNMQS